jgi:hypothetical protein
LYPILYGHQIKDKRCFSGSSDYFLIKEVSEVRSRNLSGSLKAAVSQRISFHVSTEEPNFHVSTEEPNHPTPTHNLTSPKSLKPESSSSSQADDSVKAIKKLGKMKSDTGKLHEPKSFTRKDTKKLKASIF